MFGYACAHEPTLTQFSPTQDEDEDECGGFDEDDQTNGATDMPTVEAEGGDGEGREEDESFDQEGNEDEEEDDEDTEDEDMFDGDTARRKQAANGEA